MGLNSGFGFQPQLAQIVRNGFVPSYSKHKTGLVALPLTQNLEDASENVPGVDVNNQPDHCTKNCTGNGAMW